MQHAVCCTLVVTAGIVATVAPCVLRAQPRTECQPSIAGVGSACAIPDWEGALAQPLPRYPQLLWEAEVEGEVHLRVVVDTSGVPLPRRLTVLATSHDLFTQAVRALPSWRFAIARRDGVRIDVAYETRVYFSIDAGIFPRVVISNSPRPVSLTPRSSLRISDSVVVQQIGWEIVRQLIEREPPQPTGLVFCTTLTASDTTIAMVQRVAAKRNCARTYASWIVRVPPRPEDQAPPGHIDPVWYAVRNLVRWGDDFVSLEVIRNHGNGGVGFRCAARLVDSRWQDVQCRRAFVMIS